MSFHATKFTPSRERASLFVLFCFMYQAPLQPVPEWQRLQLRDHQGERLLQGRGLCRGLERKNRRNAPKSRLFRKACAFGVRSRAERADWVDQVASCLPTFFRPDKSLSPPARNTACCANRRSPFGGTNSTLSPFTSRARLSQNRQGELYLLSYQGGIYEMPCGDICDGENVNPIGLPEPVVPETPSPVATTPAPVTAVPSAAPVAASTPAPIVPETPAPTEAPTPAPFTFAPLTPGETAAPSTASPTMAPVTPAPTAAATTAATPAPMEAATPAPVKAETEAPTAKPDPTTLAPIFVRTHAPTATAEPTAPRTASPERVEDDDYVAAPVRTATEPPSPTTPAPAAPVVPVPVTPENPEPAPTAPTAVPEPTATSPIAVAPTETVPEPTANSPIPVAPTGDFVCDGILSLLGQYCCPTECGQCGGVGCSSRPGGSDACCTSKIAANGYLCKETGAAPCRILVEGDVKLMRVYFFVFCFCGWIHRQARAQSRSGGVGASFPLRFGYIYHFRCSRSFNTFFAVVLTVLFIVLFAC